ncbi:MAG: hypothetical protein AB8G95_17750 [Anaerolineae bacterium]
MYDFIKALHDGIRWIVVLLAVIVLIKTLIGWLGKQEYKKIDRQLWLGLVNSAAIQLLLGIVLIIWLPFNYNVSLFGDAIGLRGLEHGVTNIIAVGILMYAARFKKLDDVLQHRNKFFAVLISSALIFYAVSAVGGWS